MKKIGFIGVGVMGKFMVSNLLKNGFEVSIYARNKAKVEETIKEGAIFCESIKECVQNKDAIITIVGYPKDVEELYFSQDGIINSASQNSYLIDMTTTTPTLSVKIHEVAKKKKDSENFMLVTHRQIMTGFDETFEKIISFYGLEKSEKLKNALAEQSSMQKEFKTEHIYSLDQFGITKEQIEKDFAFIYENYDV